MFYYFKYLARTLYWRFKNSRLEDAGSGGAWTVYRLYSYPIVFIGGDNLVIHGGVSILATKRTRRALGGIYRVSYRVDNYTMVF